MGTRGRDVSQQFISQLKSVIEEYLALRKISKHNDLSDLPVSQTQKFITLARATIERVGGTNSAYNKQTEDILNEGGFEGYIASRLIGVVEALYLEAKRGYLQTFSELIHGEVFSDFLEMASHLLDEGYKDAAAVIAGSSLEAHIRQLCLKYFIEIEVSTSSGLKPKKADNLNSDLANASVYTKLDQKNVTAWLDLRNKAAHGKYSQYMGGQVGIMISGIRDFLTRIPA